MRIHKTIHVAAVPKVLTHSARHVEELLLPVIATSDSGEAEAASSAGLYRIQYKKASKHLSGNTPIIFSVHTTTILPPANMPAVQSGKVLVTGANGYIAAWTVNTLLEQGYSVRGTVRSEAKAAALQKIFSKYGDKLEFVIIGDIGKVCNDLSVQIEDGLVLTLHLICHLGGCLRRGSERR